MAFWPTPSPPTSQHPPALYFTENKSQKKIMSNCLRLAGMTIGLWIWTLLFFRLKLTVVCFYSRPLSRLYWFSKILLSIILLLILIQK